MKNNVLNDLVNRDKKTEVKLRLPRLLLKVLTRF